MNPFHISHHTLFSDQVSHPYKAAGKIVFLHILNMYMFRQETERLQILYCIVTRIHGI
jgi:hypothetical protein